MFYRFKFVTCRIPLLFREFFIIAVEIHLIVVIVVKIWLGRSKVGGRFFVGLCRRSLPQSLTHG